MSLVWGDVRTMANCPHKLSTLLLAASGEQSRGISVQRLYIDPSTTYPLFYCIQFYFNSISQVPNAVYTQFHIKMSLPRVDIPTGEPSAYVIPQLKGESISIPGSKSVIRILASEKESNNAMAVFRMDGVLADPPGFHFHNEAHDIFMVTKGSMQVWAGDKCRTLSAGDFAYVPPVSH